MPRKKDENPLLLSGRNSKGQFTKGNGHAFKKGASGNPGGLPKGTTKLSIAYQKQLAQPVPNDPHGRIFAEAIAFSVCVAAARGDISAAREIADRVEGKARQALDIEMALTDWREMARANGVSEVEVIREARMLIESADDASGDECD